MIKKKSNERARNVPRKEKTSMKKQIIAGMAAAMVCVGAVGGTFAYLTSTAEVENTFSVGKVKITLDEAPVGTDGKKIDGDRVTKNDYHLIPGGKYDKDPTVHVEAGSEDSYIFVKISNEIASIADVTSQISDKGWTAVPEYDDVYYKEYSTDDQQTDYVVFETLSINGEVTGETLAELDNTDLTVTAYAIQQAGFEDDVVGAYEEVAGLATE